MFSSSMLSCFCLLACMCDVKTPRRSRVSILKIKVARVTIRIVDKASAPWSF